MLWALAIIIVLFQLIDTYIRSLAFQVPEEVERKLWLSYFVWGAGSFILYQIFFVNCGINAATYKIILMIGWLPYFFITVKILSFGLLQHIFVFGMAAICSTVQHTISAMIVLLNFDNLTNEKIILYVAAGYLLLFALLLPIYKRYFVNLLPSREIFDLRPQGIYIAILPLIILSFHLIRLIDDVLIHSWAERLSRIYLPVVFFFFYHYILIAAKKFYNLQRATRNKRQLEERLSMLKNYNEQIEENQKLVSVMRHDLRHSYNLIHSMLKNGLIDEAREHISKQEKILESKFE